MRAVKTWAFSFLKAYFLAKNDSIILKMTLTIWYQTRKTTFTNNIFSFIQVHQSYFSKNVPYFVGSQLSSLARYQKIIWECSSGCKDLLNFNYHTLKFYNCHQLKTVKNVDCVCHLSDLEKLDGNEKCNITVLSIFCLLKKWTKKIQNSHMRLNLDVYPILNNW